MKKSIALPLPVEDAEYILERVAATLRAHGVPKSKALKPLTEAAQRILSISSDDHDLTVSRKVINIEARRIAQRLLAA
jgi:hypothetical protein